MKKTPDPGEKPIAMYLRLFLATGVPMSLIMGLFGLLAGEGGHSFVIGLAGLTTGAAMSGILGTIHLLSVRRLPHGMSPDALKVRQPRTFTLEMPADAAFDACLAALEAVPRCRIKVCDRLMGRIVALKETTWRSFGDTISFTLRPVDERRTEVALDSRPVVPTQMVDNGSNWQNVEKITGRLQDPDGVGSCCGPRRPPRSPRPCCGPTHRPNRTQVSARRYTGRNRRIRARPRKSSRASI